LAEKIILSWFLSLPKAHGREDLKSSLSAIGCVSQNKHNNLVIYHTTDDICHHPTLRPVEPGDGSDGEGGTICDLHDSRT
jgi:hypothetical protein